MGERLQSWYNHQYTTSSQFRKNFEKFAKYALNLFNTSERSNRNDLVTIRGNYAEQLERYFQYFERAHILVMSYDEFVGQQRRYLRRVVDFLGLSKSRRYVPAPRSNQKGHWSKTIACSLRKTFSSSLAREN